jgi:hypothetical protein
MFSREAHQRRTRAITLAAVLTGAFLVGFAVVSVSPVLSLAGVLALTVAACLYISRSRDA